MEDEKTKGLDKDLSYYLECLHHSEDPKFLRETINSLAGFITTNGQLKDMMREKKGLHHLIKLLISSEDASIKQSCLFALSCAIDGCVSSQNFILSKQVMSVVCRILTKSNKLCQNAAFFIGCVVQGNSLGQNKARHSGAMTQLIRHMRENVPSEDDSVWVSMVTALSSCINNPMNSLNQDLCMEILPLSMQVIRANISSISTVRPTVSFISLCLSGNDDNQATFSNSGCLMSVLEMLEGLSHDTGGEVAWVIIALISNLSEALRMNSAAQQKLVPLLLSWLGQGTCNNVGYALQTLSVIVDCNEQAKCALVEEKGGMSIILHCMTVGDESVKKIAQLLMQILFTGNENLSKDEVDDDSQSLESASHEYYKEISQKEKSRSILGRKRQNFVRVEKTSKWGSPAKKSKQSPVVQKEDVFFTDFKTPQAKSHPVFMETPMFTQKKMKRKVATPAPTPIITQHDIDTPPPSHEKNRSGYRDARRDSRAPSRNSSRAPSNASSRSFYQFHAKEVAAIVEEKVDKRLSAFIDRFEKVLVTTNKSHQASNLASNIPCHLASNPPSNRKSNLAYKTNLVRYPSYQNSVLNGQSSEASRSTLRESKNASNCHSLFNGAKASSKRHQPDKVSYRENNDDKTFIDDTESVTRHSILSTSSMTRAQMVNITRCNDMAQEELDYNGSDTVSVITHISQETLLQGFFSDNPQLNPLPDATLASNVALVNIANDSFTDLTLSKDSGFDNTDNKSSDVVRDISKDMVSDAGSTVSSRRSVKDSGPEGGQFVHKWPVNDLSKKFFSRKLSSFTQHRSSGALSITASSHAKSTASSRNQLQFSEQELANLCKGVQTLGKSWDRILMRFDFHISRTPGDLRRKYCHIKKYICEVNRDKCTSQEWSDGELKRLKRGVLRYGSDWATIRRKFSFNTIRSVKDLANKWGSLQRQ